ncbi:hypothetical protein R6Z07F_013223 [Ovis aries]
MLPGASKEPEVEVTCFIAGGNKRETGQVLRTRSRWWVATVKGAWTVGVDRVQKRLRCNQPGLLPEPCQSPEAYEIKNFLIKKLRDSWEEQNKDHVGYYPAEFLASVCGLCFFSK